MAEAYVCAKCKKDIKRGESSISAVKNLKRLYYHARCFGADHLETAPLPEESTEQKPSTDQTS